MQKEDDQTWGTGKHVQKQEDREHALSPAAAAVQHAKSLLSEAVELRKADELLDDRSRKRKEQEAQEAALLKEANHVQTKALTSASDIATGERSYAESLTTSWTCPKYLAEMAEEKHQANRKKWGIVLEGDDCPPPMKNFKDMKTGLYS